jgi:2-keto-3-deoxy-L-rhamnonate aldolase RhmA
MKQPNRVKTAMRAGRRADGYNLSFPSPWVIDILGKLDFDFVFIVASMGRSAWISSRTCAGPPNAII